MTTRPCVRGVTAGAASAAHHVRTVTTFDGALVKKELHIEFITTS